jgi:hypothetical protein
MVLKNTTLWDLTPCSQVRKSADVSQEHIAFFRVWTGSYQAGFSARFTQDCRALLLVSHLTCSSVIMTKIIYAAPKHRVLSTNKHSSLFSKNPVL